MLDAHITPRSTNHFIYGIVSDKLNLKYVDDYLRNALIEKAQINARRNEKRREKLRENKQN